MYSFTFRQIEVFLEICRVGNFSSAAARLDVSQPAISNAIHSLESELGVKLFDRRRGASCVVTSEGKAFQECAQQFIARCETIGTVARTGRRKRRPLRVFIGAHLLEDYIRPALSDFYDEHPQLQMTFLPEKHREQIVQDIQTGRIDVAVITVPAEERPPGSLLVGVVPAGIFGLRANRGPFTAETISMLPLVQPPPGTQLAASMLRHLEQHGIHPARAVHCPYHDVRIRMACRGKGVVFAIQSVVDKHDPRGQLRLLFPTDPWERRLYINPRVEPASATAIASFVSRALSVAPGS
jgi:DNA-binding transcriptional LysR family regulator